MAPAPLFVGDFGLALRITVADAAGDSIDISSSTAREFEIEDPQRNTTTVVAVFITDGTDGRLQYVLQAGDLDEKGEWKVRAKITEGATKMFRTEKYEFPVKP